MGEVTGRKAKRKLRMVAQSRCFRTPKTAKLFLLHRRALSLLNISTACVFGSISRPCVTLVLPMGADGSDNGDLLSSGKPVSFRNEYP